MATNKSYNTINKKSLKISLKFRFFLYKTRDDDYNTNVPVVQGGNLDPSYSIIITTVVCTVMMYHICNQSIIKFLHRYKIQIYYWYRHCITYMY